MKADRHIKLIFSNKVVKRHGMKHEVYYILAEETTDLLVSFTFLKNIPKRTRAIMRSFIFVAVALSHDCRITQQSSWKKRSSRIESQPAIMSRLNCISPVTAAPTFWNYKEIMTASNDEMVFVIPFHSITLTAFLVFKKRLNAKCRVSLRNRQLHILWVVGQDWFEIDSDALSVTDS